MITGGYLKSKRLSIGFSQRTAAGKIGISQAHLSKIETGRVDARLSTVNKLLKLYEDNSQESVEGIMCNKVISASSFDSVRKASDLMKKHDISQLPIIDSGIVVGSVSEDDIINNLRIGLGDREIGVVMVHPFPIVNVHEPIQKIKNLVLESKAVLVSNRGKIVGIITKYDLLKLVR